MNWGLKAGLLGGRQQTLAPATTAMGPNAYLQQPDFFRMLAIALGLHLIILAIVSLWPDEHVTDIPVRALSFKIGGTQRITFAPVAAPAPVAPIAAPTGGKWRAAAKPVEAAPQPKIIPVTPPAQRQAPQENPVPLSAIARPQPTPQALPDTSVLTQPVQQQQQQQVAVAPTPQRFIRETGTPTPDMVGPPQTALTPNTPEANRQRYEMEISGWVARHTYYPSNGHGDGRAVVRIRIDRTGYVRNYVIEESAGSPALDAAALDIVRLANPLPAVPADYPAGNLIEFVMPIVFREPKR